MPSPAAFRQTVVSRENFIQDTNSAVEGVSVSLTTMDAPLPRLVSMLLLISPTYSLQIGTSEH